MNEDNFWIDIKVFLAIEMLLYFIDLFNMIFNFVILIKAHQFHFNFSCIQAVLFVIHFVDNIAILVLRTLMILEFVDDSDPSSGWNFWIPMNVTLGCTFAAMCTLFSLTVERYCATFLINDYEKKQRRSISFLLNFFLLLFGGVSCVVIREKENTVFVIAILLLINGIALVLHFLLLWWNKKLYSRLHNCVSVTSYSLTQRFQVSENIKSLQMMNAIIYYMGFMNLIVVLSVLFSSFDVTSELELFITFCLDISIFVYSFCYPLIMHHSCERWQTEITRFLQWTRIVKPSSKVYPILNTFGKTMEQENSMRNHFDNLQQAWDLVGKRKSVISLSSR